MTVECNSSANSTIDEWLRDFGGAGVDPSVQCDGKDIQWSHNYENVKGDLGQGEQAHSRGQIYLQSLVRAPLP